MTRWARLGRQPERVWVVWDPDRWLLPVPWESAAFVIVLGLVSPGALMWWLSGRHSAFFVLLGGLFWAAVTAWLVFLGRRGLRRKRTRRARGNDWVCAACLHTEPGT